MEVEEEIESWFSNFVKQLSGIMVIMIIVGGILICVLLFIFAKRQIVRFTIRSHRGIAPGANASTSMRREIYRRMEAINKITYEPKMLSENSENLNPDNLPFHHYRMKTMDASKTLDDTILRKKLGKRQNFESLRSYLISTFSSQIDQRVIHQYCDLYEGARFNPKPFTDKEYKQFVALLQQLCEAVAQLEPKRSVRGYGTASLSTSRDNANNKSFSSDTSHLLRRSKGVEKARSIDGKDTVELMESTHHILDSSGQKYKSTNV